MAVAGAPACGSPCPQRVQLEEICSAYGRCVAGSRVVTSPRQVALPQGETLTIQVAPFAGQLSEAPDLLLDFPYVPPRVTDAVIERDGVQGAFFFPNIDRPEVGSARSVRWNLPVAEVHIVTIRCDLGDVPDIFGWFEDGPCEDDHPAPWPD